MASKLSKSWAPMARTALQRSRIIIPVRSWPAHSARTISSLRAQSRTSSSPLRTYRSSSRAPPHPPSLLRLHQRVPSSPRAIPLYHQRGGPNKISIQIRNYEFRPSQYDPDGSRLRDAKPLLTKSNLGRVARSPNTHIIALLAIAGAFIFYFSNLETVPVSGRTRFNVYSADSVRKMSDMQYKMLLYEFERNNIRILGDYDPRTQRVRRVMKKLIPFSGMGDNDEKWEIYVVDDPHTANAFVLPGGKVFVFSGILPLARTDSALAAVLGHEIAHNVAGHVGERMSGSIGTNILLYSGMLVAAGIGLGPLLMHYLGSKVLTVALENPMSRKQEIEADYIGLMIMAEACYDPRDAVRFWERMEGARHGQNGGDDVPEWASTHPSNENRIKKIQEWLPKAMEKRDMSDCRTTTAFADLFRRALETGVLIVEE